MSNDLTSVERSRLRQLEKIISDGAKAFVSVGLALGEIRDSQLFRKTHKTFEAYIKEQWGFGRQYAYRLIDSAGVQAKLSPMGDKIPEANTITTERQLRELKDVPDEKLEEVVERAAVIASDAGTPITAAVLREAKKEQAAAPVVIDAKSTAIDSGSPSSKPSPKAGDKPPPVDAAAERARAMIPELVRKLALQLGNLGSNGRFDRCLQEIEEFAR